MQHEPSSVPQRSHHALNHAAPHAPKPHSHVARSEALGSPSTTANALLRQSSRPPRTARSARAFRLLRALWVGDRLWRDVS